MSDFTLPTFANGDADYVAKLNSLSGLTQTAVQNLQAQQGGINSGNISAQNFLQALFGDDPCLVGYDSYKCTGSGAILTVATGTAWKPSTATIVVLAASAMIDFTGQSAATYYIAIDSAGNPSRVASSSEAFFSVVWTGTAFGTITRLAKCFMTAAEEQALLHSTVLSMDFATLMARLEYIEGLL